MYYSEKWNDLEKEQFKECLRKKDFDSLKNFSCFSDFGCVRGVTAAELLKKIFFDIDEDDLDIQEKFYYLLDGLLDGISELYYLEEARDRKFNNVHQINQEILEYFNDVSSETADLVTEAWYLIDTIVKDNSYFDDCYNKLLELYAFYKKGKFIPREASTEFYNYLLNRQRNDFISETKADLIWRLCKMLPYTKRKENSIRISAKLKKIDEIFKNNRYQELGTTEQEIRNSIDNFSTYLSSLKEMRKEHIEITEEQCSLMNEKFLLGDLKLSDIKEICLGVSDKVANVILNKYTQIKLKYLSKISVADDELPKLELGYNYNNYKIVTVDGYYDNLIKIFSTIEEKDGQQLLQTAENYRYIFLLVFFINYFSEIDLKSVLCILKNYPRIVNGFGNYNEETKEVFGVPYDKLILLSEAYENSDDFTIMALGIDVVKKIVSGDVLTSKNPMAYTDVFLKMLKRNKTSIPPVSGEYENYYYESARDADCERLLIGKNCGASCIGIDGAGEDAFLSVLTGPSADVIIFRDKETNDFIARSLCFRAGNYVVLAPIYGKSAKAREFYNLDLLSSIANQMLSKAREAHDTLEYVFFTEGPVDLKAPLFKDDCLWKIFPHADIHLDKYLIGGKSDDVRLDSDKTVLSSYDTVREKVKSTDEISNEELNKLRVLKILFSDDKYLIAEKRKNFQAISKESFDDVYMGQDWYVALKDGKIVDKVVLPVGSERQEEELLKLSSYLTEINVLDDITSILMSEYTSRR